jgi:hypothetical protein
MLYDYMYLSQFILSLILNVALSRTRFWWIMYHLHDLWVSFSKTPSNRIIFIQNMGMEGFKCWVCSICCKLCHDNASLFEALQFTSKDAEQKFMLQFSQVMTYLSFCWTTWCYISEDNTLHSHCSENFKSSEIKSLYWVQSVLTSSSPPQCV